MLHQRTITGTDMRDINRSAILEIIRRESPISRTTIARRLGVSLPTVMRIVDELTEEGFVRMHGDTEWSGGRRRSLLEFNAEGHVVMGIDLGGANMFGALADLGGNVIDEVEIDRHSAGGEECLRHLAELIEALLASPKLQGRQVRGVGVGVPGITHHREGVVSWAFALNWQDYPLKAKLMERFHMPITVDNDVNLAALGELWFGAGQKAQNMVFITVAAGIGAGIIIDGALYRGSHEASGEIGHFVPGREFLGQCYAEFGALESMASGTGITERARRVLAAQGTAAEGLRVEQVFEAARQGQPWAQEIIDETVDYLAIAVANMSVAFDPEIIVLGGSVTHFADQLIGPMLRRINGAIPTPPPLVVSALGRRAVVMGAITHVLHNTADFYLVRKLS